MPKLGTICITNQAPASAVIDIEGIIGVPEWWQFDDPADRVSTFDKFKKKCGEIKDLKATDITVNIRSIGGSVSHALLIHDSLCMLGANVTTVCYGYTASAATLVAQAGRERQISSNALYLVHQCLARTSGNVADLRNAIEEMEKTNDRIVNLYADRSGKTTDHFRELIDRKDGNGEWLSPSEAVSLGLADKVITVTGAVNMDMDMDMDMFAEMGYPEIPENLFPEPPEDANNTNNNNLMAKIQNTLSALWDFFKFPADVAEHDITNEHLTQVNNELTTRQATINNLTNERDQLKNDIQAKDTRITELENQVAELSKKPGDTTNQVAKETDANQTKDDVLFNISEAKSLYDSIKDC